MIDKHFLSDLRCPMALARSEIEDLSQNGDVLQSKYGSYPVIDGIPDLRFPEDREATSYDNILPEWQEPSTQPEQMKKLASAMEIQRDDIKGKKVLIAGVGGGTELDLALSFEPEIIYAVDFSSFLRTLSKSNKYSGKNIRYLVGDLCNLPFRENVFDYIISSGIIHHTRSPELAHRNLWRALKPGGCLNYGHIYLENEHNNRVSIDRLRKQYHKMPPEKAKRILSRYARIYPYLVDSGIIKIINKIWPIFPFAIELSEKKNAAKHFHFMSATDYYLCRYRHVLNRDDIIDWFVKMGRKVQLTPKGFKGTK